MLSLHSWLRVLVKSYHNSSTYFSEQVDIILIIDQKYPRMALSPEIGIVEINTPWHFRYLQIPPDCDLTIREWNELPDSTELSDELDDCVSKFMMVGPVFVVLIIHRHLLDNRNSS